MQSVTAVLDLIERDIGFGILPFGAVRRRVEEDDLKSFTIADPRSVGRLGWFALRAVSYPPPTVQ